MKKTVLIVLILALLFGALVLVTKREPKDEITNFEECATKGGKLLLSYPAKCVTPEGKTFVQELEEKEEDDKVIKPLPMVVRSYDDCVKTEGSVLIQTDPAQCRTPDGQTFVDQSKWDTPSNY